MPEKLPNRKAETQHFNYYILLLKPSLSNWAFFIVYIYLISKLSSFMENKIETLLNKLEFGEVINFNNSYLIINPDELNREKVNKNIKNSFIALSVSLLKFHGVELKTNEDFLKFKIIRNFTNIHSFFIKNFKISNFIDLSSNSNLNLEEKKIIKVFKKLNLLPFPIFLSITLANKRKASLFKINEIYKQVNQSKVVYKNQAFLPLKKNKKVKIYLFDDLILNITHYALIFNFNNKNTIPNIRVHSSCLTGDLMGSQKCDCGYQLDTSIDYMSKSKSIGVLIYLNQEGRGLGIHNKIISYNIQDHGYNTYEADKILGFSGDERNYKAASKILKFFKFKKVNLITNNPEKIDSLKDNGFIINKTIRIKPGISKFNKNYLITKKKIGKHMINL